MTETDYKLKVGIEAENQIDQSKIKKQLQKTKAMKEKNILAIFPS